MSTNDFHTQNVADKRGVAERQTRRSANTIIMMRSMTTKTKKMKVVKEDPPFQSDQIVVVSHGKATQQSVQHRSQVTGIKSINQSTNQSIGLDQSQQQKLAAMLNDPWPNRLSNSDADQEPDRISSAAGRGNDNKPSWRSRPLNGFLALTSNAAGDPQNH